MIDNKRQELIHSQVMEILKENQLAFSNVARPKPTKASTATSASWSKDLAPKASAATQGAWDSTNTPGGVSSLAKEKWNVQEIAALVTKALESNNVKVAFSNKPIPDKDSFISLCRIFREQLIPLLEKWFDGDIERIRYVLGDNGKSRPDTIFFQEIPFRDGLFKGDIPDSFDKERRIYRCNEEAFYNPKVRRKTKLFFGKRQSYSCFTTGSFPAVFA